MEKLHKKNENSYFITKRKAFVPLLNFSELTINTVFNFAYDMTYGVEGKHRNYRSGGHHKRSNGEIFINTFQGKLSEFGIYYYLRKNNIKDIEPPCLEKWQLGIWDESDFTYGSKKISIKSTKFYGNLILLETKNWNKDGKYKPSNTLYDITILVRIKPDGENLLKKQRMLYNNTTSKEQLQQIIRSQKWQCDIPGFATIKMLKEVINETFILPQNSYLNGTTKMDATNYYIQVGDLIDIKEIRNIL